MGIFRSITHTHGWSGHASANARWRRRLGNAQVRGCALLSLYHHRTKTTILSREARLAVKHVASMSDAHQTPRLPPVTLNTSQYSSEVTTTRLPTPSQQRFCEPCRAFLRGDSTKCFGPDKYDHSESLDHEYIHHVDAESFQRALELPCSICTRLYKAFQRTSGIVGFIRASHDG